MVKDEHIAVFENSRDEYEVWSVEGYKYLKSGKAKKLIQNELLGTFDTKEEAIQYAKQKKKEVGFSKIYVYGDI
ncbi:hypothetical protein ABEO92_13240 [Geobacillus stearothermophilus]|uniref:hypothetical protein n=1 Tax=Geobacillus stearothermophilus TaxID=1422 RepID=UPI003D1AEB94